MSGHKKSEPPPQGGTLKQNRGGFYGYPMGLWFLFFFVMPILIIVVYSFLKKGVHGGVEWQFTLNAYEKLLNPNYGRVLLRTLWVAAVSTLFIIMIALPAGYAMARSKHQTLMLFLIIIPFWTNSLIRIYAWQSVLGTDGMVNSLLLRLGLVDSPLKLLYTQSAVILVLVYMYLPYAMLPIFTTIDKMDFSLLEAARDLGCSKFQSMTKVLLPNIKSGIVTAIVFTFIPIFGVYTVPSMVGGKDSYMIGNIIVDQVLKVRNWPLASAFSMVITVVSTVGVALMMNSGGGHRSRHKGSESG